MKTFNKTRYLAKFLFAINLKNLAKTTILLSVICLYVSPVNGLSNEVTEEVIFESEKSAEMLSNQWNGDSIRRSIDLFSETADQWEKLRNFSKSSKNRCLAAELEILLGNYQKAHFYLKRALNNKTLHNYPDEKGKILSILAIISLKTGKINDSKAYLKQTEILMVNSTDIAAQAMFALSMAEFYEIESKFDKALEFYQKSSNLWEKFGDLRRSARALINCAVIYMIIGKPLDGLKVIKEAQIILNQINDTRGLAICLMTSGHLNNVMGEKQLALESYKKVEESFPTDMDFVEKARLYNGIGLIYEDYGEWKYSLGYRLKALELFRQANYFYGQLATLPSLIRLSNLLNDSNSASKYFTETKKISIQFKDTYYLAIAIRLMGDFYFTNSLYSKALSYYFSSLKTLEKTGLQFEIAYINDKLGTIYERLGEFQKAKSYYESSLKISQNILSKFTEANTTYNLAKLYDLENKNKDALKLISNSINITEKLSSTFLNSKLTSNYFSNVVDRYKLFINLLMKMHKQSPSENYAIQALQAAEKSRARLMLEKLALSEANFTQDANPETVKREKEIRSLLNAKADKLTDLLSQNADKVETEKTGNEINELEHELEDIKATLKQNSPIYSAIKNPEPFDVKEFQNQVLDENSILLEFSLGETESYLWLVGKDEVTSYILPARVEIESKVETLRGLIAARVRQNNETIEDYQARITKADFEYPETARQLSNALLGQVANKLSNKRLIIVPDGKLHYFPFSALPLPNSADDKPILLSNEVIYEPSASTLALISKIEKLSKIVPKNILVFSDPVFSEDDSRFLTKSETAQNIIEDSVSADKLRFAESLNSLPRLTESKDEGDSILNIAGSSKSDIFTGFAATRDQFLNAKVSDYKILHFATHGLIDENRPELSGIVFSRFNENREKLDEVVRLQDIYGLNLNADLVVLSACETGIGKEEKGEGLLSLNNGFLQVGAKTVLSSLWKVEDSATVELMKNFYEIMANENMTSSKALQKAQIKIWESGRYKSPFYWAAFTIQGDFRRKPNLSKRLPNYLLIAGLSGFILLSAFSFYYFFRRRNF